MPHTALGRASVIKSGLKRDVDVIAQCRQRRSAQETGRVGWKREGKK